MLYTMLRKTIYLMRFRDDVKVLRRELEVCSVSILQTVHLYVDELAAATHPLYTENS